MGMARARLVEFSSFSLSTALSARQMDGDLHRQE